MENKTFFFIIFMNSSNIKLVATPPSYKLPLIQPYDKMLTLTYAKCLSYGHQISPRFNDVACVQQFSKAIPVKSVIKRCLSENV